MSKSLAEEVALLSIEERRAMLDGVDMEKLQFDWKFWGRPEQFAPPGNWNVWLICAGRGFGKTRAGAEWIRDRAIAHPKCDIFLVGRTAADVRDVMVEAIIECSPPDQVPVYSVANRSLTWPNGSKALCFSAEKPDQLRGPAAHYTWADEAAAWKFIPDSSGATAWDNIRLATRRGDYPQIVATTTPKKTPYMRGMLEEHATNPERVVITRGSTFDNAGNLAAVYLDNVTGQYGGTSLARQELMGLMLEDVDGALFNEDMINAGRVPLVGTRLPLRVIAVDPSVAEEPGDECGIVVVGATNQRELHKREAWILEDCSMQASPETWVNEVVRLARKWQCPVVAEKNQGHALIDLAIKNIDTSVKVLSVHSKVGKKLRAEPVALAYEQERVHHVGEMGDLESQMCSWLPEYTRKSPDRLDALVHGVTALLIQQPKGLGAGKVRARSAASRQLSGGKGTGMTGAGRSIAGRRAA